MAQYEEHLSEFEASNAQVLGISVDSIPSSREWVKSLGGLSFPHLSDFWPHGAVAHLYGVLRPVGSSERAVFVVDREGTIRYARVSQRSGEIPPLNEQLAVLRDLQQGR